MECTLQVISHRNFLKFWENIFHEHFSLNFTSWDEIIDNLVETTKSLNIYNTDIIWKTTRSSFLYEPGMPGYGRPPDLFSIPSQLMISVYLSVYFLYGHDSEIIQK